MSDLGFLCVHFFVLLFYYYFFKCVQDHRSNGEAIEQISLIGKLQTYLVLSLCCCCLFIFIIILLNIYFIKIFKNDKAMVYSRQNTVI